MAKYTIEKYNIGVNQEYTFSRLMRVNNINLVNINDVDKYCSVDFKLPLKDVFIELKHRQISSTRYKTTLFDKKKVDIWNSSQTFSNSTILIGFSFSDNQYYFIKYNKDLFDEFDTQVIEEWNTTNYLIPLNLCIDLSTFIATIKELT